MTATVQIARVPASVVLLVSAMIFAENVEAADVDVTASVSVVRSAPFDVAPEVGRVHAGDRLAGSDQLSGEWRFVKLPDGRSGYLPERDVKVALPPIAEVLPTSKLSAVQGQPRIEPTATPEKNSPNAQSSPAPERGVFTGLWVVPFATHHFQGAGWDGGYYYKRLAGQYRLGFLQNGYEPVSGAPLLTLTRAQRFFLDLELDARWRLNRVETLALGGGVGIVNEWVDTTSMSGLSWTTATDVQWHVRPLVGLTLTWASFRGTAWAYLFGSIPEGFVSLGIYWGRR
jgi:hypothetical protein